MTGKVLHLCPDDIIHDAGWGYIAALGSKTKIGGRDWFPIIGYVHMMTESVLDWLVEEASEDFIEGKVFVAPAELIGIDPRGINKGLNALSGVTGGMPIASDYRVAKAAMELDIPFLDNMNSSDFRKFINDYSNELIRFQIAFKKVVTA